MYHDTHLWLYICTDLFADDFFSADVPLQMVPPRFSRLRTPAQYNFLPNPLRERIAQSRMRVSTVAVT